MTHKILVVDDEPKIVDMVRKFLESEGFAVRAAYDGLVGLELARAEAPDLVILDVMLPGLDGLEVLKRLRGQSDVPVIMLTARSEEIDRLLGLGLGADDYVTKPFSLRELALRIRAVLRRTQVQAERKKVTVGDLIMDPDSLEATVGGSPVDLTRGEFQILLSLVSRPGRVLTREDLLKAAFGDSSEALERTIDTHVRNIRRKVESDPANPKYILTVFGVGYKGGDGR